MEKTWKRNGKEMEKKWKEMGWMLRNGMDGADEGRPYARNGVGYRFVTDVGRPLINISLLKSE